MVVGVVLVLPYDVLVFHCLYVFWSFVNLRFYDFIKHALQA